MFCSLIFWCSCRVHYCSNSGTSGKDSYWNQAFWWLLCSTGFFHPFFLLLSPTVKNYNIFGNISFSISFKSNENKYQEGLHPELKLWDCQSH